MDCPSFFRDRIRQAALVANPGCYPTSAILALAPLLSAKIIATDDIIIDSKSGISGAGRNPKLMTHYPECNESLSAYNIGVPPPYPRDRTDPFEGRGRAGSSHFYSPSGAHGPWYSDNNLQSPAGDGR